nr:hypothetical protein OG999_38245 [Streptomyces sp. NBC_00886]
MRDHVFSGGHRTVAVAGTCLALAAMGLGSQAHAASYATPGTLEVWSTQHPRYRRCRQKAES